MALQDLLQQVESSTQEEIEKIAENKKSEIQRIDSQFEKKIDQLKEEKERKLKQKKEKFFVREKQKQHHHLQMKLLKLKQGILEKAFEEVKKSFDQMDFNKKAKIIKNELSKVGEFLKKAQVVFVSQENFQKIAPLLKEGGVPNQKIKSKEFPFKAGILIEGEDFQVKISPRQLIEEKLRKSKFKLSEALFK